MKLFVIVLIGLGFVFAIQLVLESIGKLFKIKLLSIIIDAILTILGLLLTFCNVFQDTLLIGLPFALFFTGTSNLYYTLRKK